MASNRRKTVKATLGATLFREYATVNTKIDIHLTIFSSFNVLIYTPSSTLTHNKYMYVSYVYV